MKNSYAQPLNMTSKKMKQQAQSHLRFPQLTDVIPDPILVTDTNSRIYYVNPAWEQSTGYTFSEVKGKKSKLYGERQNS